MKNPALSITQVSFILRGIRFYGEKLDGCPSVSRIHYTGWTAIAGAVENINTKLSQQTPPADNELSSAEEVMTNLNTMTSDDTRYQDVVEQNRTDNTTDAWDTG